ncbi:NADH-quinone oxidoreductase subunit J [Balneolaceae bacterium ANBcel3]|nr:NADH-quinone oxidoreductase subunit J [Balneolaceae bacterium ANBcel3]
MELSAFLFYFFALLIIGSAAIMVFSKNIVHSAFALMFTLAGLAAFYALLYAGFVAVTQLLVYVGGILVIVLFGVMLTTRGYFEKIKTRTVHLLPAALFSMAIAIILITVFLSTEWILAPLEEEVFTVQGIGELLMTDYMLPFQVVGVLLLLAIIGAVLMATRVAGEEEPPSASG